MEGQGTENIFLLSKSSCPTLGPTQPPMCCVLGFRLWGKVPGAWSWPFSSIQRPSIPLLHCRPSWLA